MKKNLPFIILLIGFLQFTYATTSDTLVKKNTDLRNAKKHFDNLDAKIALKQAFNSKGKFKSFKSFTQANIKTDLLKNIRMAIYNQKL